MKLAIPFLLATFACADLLETFSDVNFLNSWVVIYISWSKSVVIFISFLLTFCVTVSFFFIKLQTLSILCSMAIKAALVAKLVVLGTLFLTSFILALRAVAVPKLVILGILFFASFIVALRVVLVGKVVISSILSSIYLTLLSYTSV